MKRLRREREREMEEEEGKGKGRGGRKRRESIRRRQGGGRSCYTESLPGRNGELGPVADRSPHPPPPLLNETFSNGNKIVTCFYLSGPRSCSPGFSGVCQKPAQSSRHSSTTGIALALPPRSPEDFHPGPKQKNKKPKQTSQKRLALLSENNVTRN